MNDSPTPSDAQLEILDLLWRDAPLSVRDLHATIEQRRPMSYTTVLTQLQRMHEAGFVERDTSSRSHLYRPAVQRASIEKGLFGKLAETAFGGSRVTLALRALGNETPTADELDELRKWIDDQA